VKQSVLILFIFLFAGLGVAASAAAPLTPGPDTAGPASGLIVPVQRRCVPSRCGCRGSQTTWCSRDCRRDRLCSCVRGRYVCSLYVSW
jgi:hypothetical protein